MRWRRGDADGAAALVEACAMPLIMQSHLTMVRQWLSLLPPDLIARRPRLQLAEVWIQFHMSRPQEAVKTLKAAKRSIAALAGERRHRPARKPCAAGRAVDADRRRHQRRRPFAHRGAAVRDVAGDALGRRSRSSRARSATSMPSATIRSAPWTRRAPPA